MRPTAGRISAFLTKERHQGDLVVGCMLFENRPLPHLFSSNWGLTEAELLTIPPSLARSFSKGNALGFGSELPGGFGRLLMRGELNSDLYGPLQELYLQGQAEGSDVWVHKNRQARWFGIETTR